MSDLFNRLNKVELLEFSSLLGSDADSYSLTELDGFLHGILCLPRMVAPSEWLEEVLPESVAATKAQATRTLDLTFRYYNAVAAGLQNESPEPRLDGSAGQAWEWLTGFGQGFGYEPEALIELADAEAELLQDNDNVAITALVLAFSLDLENAPEDEDRDEFLSAKEGVKNMLAEQTPQDNLGMIKGLLLSVYDLLEPARKQNKRSLAQSSEPLVREQPKPGRNEPCYCGSGKKYKHCHGKYGAA